MKSITELKETAWAIEDGLDFGDPSQDRINRRLLALIKDVLDHLEES